MGWLISTPPTIIVFIDETSSVFPLEGTSLSLSSSGEIFNLISLLSKKFHASQNINNEITFSSQEW